MSPVIEARVIELRRMHPGWGPRSLRTRLEHEGFSPVPGRYSSTHKTPEIHRWLLRHPRFTLHFTPTYSSWMNLVERWFAELTNKWLRRGTHRSTRELEASINCWIETWNDEPNPFVWHKSADEILDTLARYCARISDSRHRERSMMSQCGGCRLASTQRYNARMKVSPGGSCRLSGKSYRLSTNVTAGW
jgi:hypothetical protein